MPYKIYVGNIPFQLEEDDLTNLFSTMGTVSSIKIPTDRDTGRPRGFAFVEMDSKDAAEAAVTQLNGTNLGGRNISVAHAVEKDPDTAASKPYAIKLGADVCILCQKHSEEVFGFDKTVGGICTTCITSLSRASRPPREQRPFMRSPDYGERKTGNNRY
jgi:RNA recognition motif-containing protein